MGMTVKIEPNVRLVHGGPEEGVAELSITASATAFSTRLGPGAAGFAVTATAYAECSGDTTAQGAAGFKIDVAGSIVSTQAGIVGGAVLELHAARANAGINPGINNPLTTTAFDTSGSGNHGTLTTFAGTTASGWAGSGTLADPHRLVFDGTSDYVALPDLGAAEDSTFTYEVWFSTTDANGGVLLGEDLADGAPISFLYILSSGTLNAVQWGPGWEESRVSGPAVEDGLFHHAVATCNGSLLKLYCDGSSVGTPVAPQATAALNKTTLGTLLGAWFFSGSIAVARIYPFALTAEEVAQNYAAGYLWSKTSEVHATYPVTGAGTVAVTGAATLGAGEFTAAGAATFGIIQDWAYAESNSAMGSAHVIFTAAASTKRILPAAGAASFAVTASGYPAIAPEYVSLLTGLSSGVTYYVRAYATNSDGTGYGNEVDFTAAGSGNAVAGAAGFSISGLMGASSPLYNVMDYGAHRNGTTTDVDHIQAAISAANATGGTVYFPAGDYYLGSTLTVPAGTKLLGASVAALAYPVSGCDVPTSWLKGKVIFGSNSTFSDLRIGNSGTSTQNGSGATNTSFTRCQFRGGGGSASSNHPVFRLGHDYSCDHITLTDCNIERCMVTDAQRDADVNRGFSNFVINARVNGESVHYATLDGCHDGVSNGMTPAQGVAVNTGSPQATFLCWTSRTAGTATWDHITVTDTVLEAGDWDCVDFADYRSGTICNNVTFTHCWLKGATYDTLCIEGPQYIEFDDCTFGRGGEQCLYLHTFGSESTRYAYYNIHDCTFDMLTDNGVPDPVPGGSEDRYLACVKLRAGGNTFKDNVMHLNKHRVALWLNDFHHSTISGNSFTNHLVTPDSPAVYDVRSYRGVSVTHTADNTFHHLGTVTPTYYDGGGNTDCDFGFVYTHA